MKRNQNQIIKSNANSAPKSELEKQCQCCLLDCYCDVFIRHEWTWDSSLASTKVKLFKDNLAVKFNPGYSNGTTAIRGSECLAKGRHHYWEIKILTPVYGTDIMVGVGTKNVKTRLETYCSLLGRDCESWGLSYRGYIQHGGVRSKYCGGFVMDNVVGIHLDTWKGTLQFFVNRIPLGVAFTGLRDRQLYPMACSTAAESNMRIIYNSSEPASLQMDCLEILKPIHRAYLCAAFPGMRHIFKSVFADILRKNHDEDDENDDEFLKKFSSLDKLESSFTFETEESKRSRLDNWQPSTLQIDSLNI